MRGHSAGAITKQVRPSSMRLRIFHSIPTIARAIWQFGRTRFVVALLLVVFSMIFQFAGPVGCLITQILSHIKTTCFCNIF